MKFISKKMNLRPFKLYGVYLKPRNSSDVGEFSWSWIFNNFIHVQIEEGQFVVVCPRPPQNVELGGFTWQWCSGRQRNVLKNVMHVQSSCFANKTIVFLRCPCRLRHRSCLSSLIVLSHLQRFGHTNTPKIWTYSRSSRKRPPVKLKKKLKTGRN